MGEVFGFCPGIKHKWEAHWDREGRMPVVRREEKQNCPLCPSNRRNTLRVLGQCILIRDGLADA